MTIRRLRTPDSAPMTDMAFPGHAGREWPVPRWRSVPRVGDRVHAVTSGRLAAALAVSMLAALTSCAADRGGATAPPFEDAGTTSIGAAAAPTTEPPIQSIAMVGDSITNGSKVELLEQLATLGVEIKAIDAEDGRRIAAGDSITPGIDAVRALAAGDAPDLWVIALGTNDVDDGPGGVHPGHRRARRCHPG